MVPEPEEADDSENMIAARPFTQVLEKTPKTITTTTPATDDDQTIPSVVPTTTTEVPKKRKSNPLPEETVESATPAEPEGKYIDLSDFF